MALVLGHCRKGLKLPDGQIDKHEFRNSGSKKMKVPQWPRFLREIGYRRRPQPAHSRSGLAAGTWAGEAVGPSFRIRVLLC